MQGKIRRLLAGVGVAALLLSGATVAYAADPTDPTSSSTDVNDPWEGMNRGIFRFNEGLDRWALEPVAKGWDFVMPDPVERSISKFFTNIRFPVVFLNNLLQGKGLHAVHDLGRFLINTTVGVAGFFDPASHLGLPQHDEDFGQTLGYWGVPPGPYLVLPLLGPSSPRDTVGLGVDTATQAYRFFLPWWINLPVAATDVINTRSSFLEQYAAERRDAIDLYAFRRNLHIESRENLVNDRAETSDVDDDLYHVDP